jgi:hypothetical protein
MRACIALAAGVILVVACSAVAKDRAGGGSTSVSVSSETLARIGQRIEGQLRPASAFGSIADRDQRSAALFIELGAVITHPRCTNCHPRTDSPLQGDQRVLHSPPVTRGPDGHGVAGMQCSTCHGPRHVPFDAGPGSIPGNAKWALAPAEMAWEGKSIGEICEQLRDRTRNGGMTLAEIQHHNAEDILVAYGWDPGPGRQPAPGTQREFGELTQAWIDSGAICPAG